MENLNEKVAELNELIKELRYEEAHDKFYAENLIKHENEDSPTIGLKKHREEMTVFMVNVSNYSATVKQIFISDTISVVEWKYQFDHVQWGYRVFNQVSIQRWKDGKIIHERHHYQTPSW